MKLISFLEAASDLGDFMPIGAIILSVVNVKKTNEKGLKTLSFNDKDKIKGKVNSTRIEFLVEEQYLSGDVGRIFAEPRKFLGVFISCILFCSTECDFW
ncbi:hypothetical protein DVH24_004301 [Malus domestica]|uniref:Uncharacterized protein n=1 Tax=Malus domestica TaxID=3750 RepID=A0A498K5W4_MALDO|nr:hypothetical protein DVH24_004301 [Malus domestica]